MTDEKKLEDFLPNKDGSYYKKFELTNEVSLINEEEIPLTVEVLNQKGETVNIETMPKVNNLQECCELAREMGDGPARFDGTRCLYYPLYRI